MSFRSYLERVSCAGIATAVVSSSSDLAPSGESKAKAVVSNCKLSEDQILSKLGKITSCNYSDLAPKGVRPGFAKAYAATAAGMVTEAQVTEDYKSSIGMFAPKATEFASLLVGYAVMKLA